MRETGSVEAKDRAFLETQRYRMSARHRALSSAAVNVASRAVPAAYACLTKRNKKNSMSISEILMLYMSFSKKSKRSLDLSTERRNHANTVYLRFVL